jgi:hypothetical protein
VPHEQFTKLTQKPPKAQEHEKIGIEFLMLRSVVLFDDFVQRVMVVFIVVEG